MTRALLALEDGTVWEGEALGAAGETFGELVFNTGMSGYQEVLTDPSYARQIVVMTAPQQGNYGVNPDDPESSDVRAAGFVVREAARRPSSWRSHGTLGAYLSEAGVVGIEGVDTREVTLHIRERGALRAAISTEDLDEASLSRRAADEPEMAGADLARSVSVEASYDASEVVGPPERDGRRALRVGALDWGVKRGSLRMLARTGCDVTVVPALTPAEELLGFDGVFLSNGPGDPAATPYAIRTARALLGRVPLFGICLGHQILAIALGGDTYKLRFGHRGANQPVLDLDRGRVEVTSHNHGFAVDARAWDGHDAPSPTGMADGPEDRRAGPPIVDGPFGRAALTHWNLNDGTLEGLRCLDVPAFSVQYHPEAAPGPHDSTHLFERFRELMERGA